MKFPRTLQAPKANHLADPRRGGYKYECKRMIARILHCENDVHGPMAHSNFWSCSDASSCVSKLGPSRPPPDMTKNSEKVHFSGCTRYQLWRSEQLQRILKEISHVTAIGSQ